MKKVLSAILCAALAVSSVTAAAAASAPLRGDVNLDGVVNIADATTVQYICAGLGTHSDEELSAADADRNGAVNVVDATFIQRLAAGIIQPDEPLDTDEVRKQGNEAVCDFSAKLLKSSVSEKDNAFVSPLSVMMALSMTANGANGATLSEMETALGAKREVLNAYFKDYIARSEGFSEPQSSYFDDEQQYVNGGMEFADSVWYNNNGAQEKLNPLFVSDVLHYYNSEVFAAPFNQSTCDSMNAWVKEKTHDMIPKLTDAIDPDALMYLINTIAFEGNWTEPYSQYDVAPATFTADDGSTYDIDLMRSEEDIYLRDGNYADGFMKKYRGGRYAFAAFLPKEGTTLKSYVSLLTGERLRKALSPDHSYDYVRAYLPKFSVNYTDSLKNNLQAMGMPTAFTGYADFFRMVDPAAKSSPFISDVLHKTVIDLDESGTKAAAVTAVIMAGTAAPGEHQPTYITIRLDRPFVYMIVDTETGTPVFTGAMESFSR